MPAATTEHMDRYNDIDRDSDDDVSDEDTFMGDMDWRDTDCASVERTKGVAPHAVHRLQLPSIKGFGAGLRMTALLAAGPSDTAAPAVASQPWTLVAALDSNVLVTYDIETQRAQQQFFGHLYDIQCIAPAPAAWQQPHLFATCARSGDVKIWDRRSRSGSAAVTLSPGSTDPMNAVVLAANTGATAGGASSSSNQLGAGMLCFAGGACESVWCFDLRGGQAKPLYELSTGNMMVNSLAFHEGSSSLIAACESLVENRFGGCYAEDFVRLKPRSLEPIHQGRGGMGFGFDDEDEDGEEEEDADELEEEKEQQGQGQGQLGDAGGSAAAAAAAEDFDLGSGDPDELWWPTRAKHSAKDFRRFFLMPHTAVLAYTFSAQAERRVPHSSEPYFENGMW